METIALTTSTALRPSRKSWLDVLHQRRPPARRMKAPRSLQCFAVFAEHVHPVQSVTVPEHEPRNLLFALDDSDAAEAGAGFTLKRLARPGDRVHFVHVIADSRIPFISVGDIGLGSDDVFYSSSVDVTEAFPLEEHQTLLEKKGEEMMKRRLMKSVEERKDIHTKYHLPILTRPESASEIASVVSDLASNLKVDLMTIVSPSSGVFLDCGSVGYHCYEQSNVPVVLLPADWLDVPQTAEKNIVLILINSESERQTAMDWIQAQMSHVFEPYEFFISCVNDKCTCEIPQSTKDIAKQLEETQQKLHPACVVMYASSEKTVLEQLDELPFLADYDDDTRYTIVLLPKLQPPMADHKTYWSDYTYSEDEILQP